MAWTTSAIVTACVSLGLWRQYSTPPSTDLLATNPLQKQVEHFGSTAPLNLTASIIAETSTEHAPSDLPAIDAQQPQVETIVSEREGVLVGEPFLNASIVDQLSCNKSADQAGSSKQPPSEQALAPTLAILSYCWIVPYLEILAMLCCCYRCWPRRTDYDVQDDEEEVTSSESEHADDHEETELASFEDAVEITEAVAEGAGQEVTFVSKNDQPNEGHDDFEHRLMNLPSPARAAPTRAAAPQCKEDEDDFAKAERLLQEERWVLDDPIGIIFEEDADEHEFHRKRSKILGCFARAFSQLLQEDAKLREAGAALLEDIDRLEEEKGQAQGDAAYWRTLAEDLVSKQTEDGSSMSTEVTTWPC
jgi:hypothetical protein